MIYEKDLLKVIVLRKISFIRFFKSLPKNMFIDLRGGVRSVREKEREKVRE